MFPVSMTHVPPGADARRVAAGRVPLHLSRPATTCGEWPPAGRTDHTPRRAALHP